MKTEYYRDFYGCTASIKTSATGRSRLCVRVPQGDIVHMKTYDTYHGARIALGKYSDGTAQLVRKEN